MGSRRRKTPQVGDTSEEGDRCGNLNGQEAPRAPNHASCHEEGSDEEDAFEDEPGGLRIDDIYIPPAPPPVLGKDSGPSLIITHIVNTNFKSFAGSVNVGPFNQRFSCIIGPNGSGKSNVIDSMLFVFGYRATKIRSKKVSVLIHKSENHPNLRSCSVEIHFAQGVDSPSGGALVKIPGSEFVISRSAFVDNSSFYTIGRKKCTFKDVSKLLREHGVDLVHNRFLILQGEVELIAMMKPKGQTEHETGMLEYLEDIIGTSRFKEPLEQLSSRVDTLSDERQEKMNRVKLAEQERKALEGPMEEAKNYCRVHNEWTSRKNDILQIETYFKRKELERLMKQKAEFDEKVKVINEEIGTTQEKIRESELSVTEMRKSMESFGSEREKLKEEYSKIENKATQLKEEINQSNKKRKKAMETKKQEEVKVNDLIKLPEKNSKEIEELKVVAEKLNKERVAEEKEVEKVLASLNKETEGLQEKKDELSKHLMEVRTAKNEAQAMYDLAKSDLDIYLSNEKKAKDRLNELQKLLATGTERIKTLKPQLQDLSKRIPDAEKELGKAQKELMPLREQESTMKREYQQLRSKLEEKRQSVQNAHSKNRVLSFLMNRPGVLGRLGDLGGIDDKYDVAVSTACGPLDYIVVDTHTTAKTCVELLKQNNIGRANFIPLNQQERLWNSYNRNMRTPENVPRLFDLIKVQDERVKPAFYFGLRDTLVANDIQQAKRVAYGATRFRVVTLSGELIETSGTMSGGGNEPLRGRMGRSAVVSTAENPEQMKEIERKAEALGEKLTEVCSQISEREEIIRTLGRDLKNWTRDVQTFKTELNGLEPQQNTLKQQIKDQEGEVKNCVSDEVVRQKTAKVDKLKKAFDEAVTNADPLEKEVADLTKKIKDITGGKPKAAQQKLQKITNKLDKVEAEMAQLQVAINTAGRKQKQTEEKIASLTQEISDYENSMREADKKRDELVQKGAELKVKIEKSNESIGKISDELKELGQSKTSFIEMVNTLKSKIIADKQNFESVFAEIKDIEHQIEARNKERKGLKTLPLPEEESIWVIKDLQEEEITEERLEEQRYHFVHCEERLSKMKFNQRAIDDYYEKDAYYKTRLNELEQITNKRNAMKHAFEEARSARMAEFMAGFTIISAKLKETYQMITMGGDAELELLDSLDPFSEGVVFSVRPPRKSWKNISNLSGGEKTLSSLSLVFALHYYRPSPLYFMDEIDAALDFRNVTIVGHYIKERTKNAQFIVISLRPNMMELADVLVGIYKTHNTTKCIAITPGLYKDLAT